MGKCIGYGFTNTNRSDTKVENTLAYKQLEIFNPEEIYVDVHWHSEEREELEKLIAELGKGDVIYMYSVDTLLKGKNKGIWYYKQLLNKNIHLFVLDHSGDLPKVSPISTFFYEHEIDQVLSCDQKEKLVNTMIDISGNYTPISETGKTTYKANITNEFKEIYFMYEAYRITEDTLMKLLPEKLGMNNKQTFISLCREYEKSLLYIDDLERYCRYDKKFLELPKRTGKFPREYEEIITCSQNIVSDSETERIQKAIDELKIWSSAKIIHRWKLAKEKAPKPRKPDGRKVKPVFTK